MTSDPVMLELLAYHRAISIMICKVEDQLRKNGITPPPYYEVASIDDPQLIENVAAAIYGTINSPGSFRRAQPIEQHRARMQAMAAIAAFLNFVSNGDSTHGPGNHNQQPAPSDAGEPGRH